MPVISLEIKDKGKVKIGERILEVNTVYADFEVSEDLLERVRYMEKQGILSINTSTGKKVETTENSKPKEKKVETTENSKPKEKKVETTEKKVEEIQVEDKKVETAEEKSGEDKKEEPKKGKKSKNK